MNETFSMCQDGARGVIERIGAADDDAITLAKTLENLDLGDAGGAETDRMPLRHVVVNDVGKSPAFLIHEAAAIDHQDVVAPIDQYPHPEPLALAQARRLVVAEPQPRRDLPVDDFGCNAAHRALPMPAAAFQIRLHARTKIPGHALRNLDLNLEGRQIDDRQERRIFRNAGTVGYLHLADLTLDGGPDAQGLHLALEVGHHELLPIQERFLAVDIEPIERGLSLVGHFSLRESELRFFQGVLGPERLQFRIGAEFVGLAAA